jgi:hypothetical protein
MDRSSFGRPASVESDDGFRTLRRSGLGGRRSAGVECVRRQDDGGDQDHELFGDAAWTARCDEGEVCTWYWEYWPADAPRLPGRAVPGSEKTPVQGPVTGPTGNRKLSTRVTGLVPSTTYRWVFCASPNSGGVYACAGPHGTFGSTTADPPPDYSTLTTAPVQTLAEHWDGKRWTIQPTPSLSGNATLLGVSCTSATACTAVGAH